MVAKQRSDDPWEKEPTAGLIQFPRLAEPVLLVAFVSVIIYFLSYGYYQAFFERLSIPYKCLDLPLTFYLSIGYWTAIVSVLVIVCVGVVFAFEGRSGSPKRKFPGYASLIVSICAFCLVIWDLFFVGISQPRDYLQLLFRGWASVTFFLIYMVIMNKKRLKTELSNIAEDHLDCIFYLSMLLLIITMLFLVMVPNIAGSYSAANLIEGGPGSLSISFDIEDNNLNISNKTFILAMLHNDMYYVVEKATPAPDKASLYIIPSEHVKAVHIRSIEGTNDTYQRLANITQEFKNRTISLNLPTFGKVWSYITN